MTTQIALDELRRLLGEATPESWTREWLDDDEGDVEIMRVGSGHRIALIESRIVGENHVADADLIVALRNAAPDLLARIDSLQAQLAACEGRLAGLVAAAEAAPRRLCRRSCPHWSNKKWACQCGAEALCVAIEAAKGGERGGACT